MSLDLNPKETLAWRYLCLGWPSAFSRLECYPCTALTMSGEEKETTSRATPMMSCAGGEMPVGPVMNPYDRRVRRLEKR